MKALILVDPQNDFCPGGALAVPEGDEVIPLANRLERHFELVVATQDWHPVDHASFAANHHGKQPGEVIELAGQDQILWPVHCVRHTHGAAFHRDLQQDHIVKVFRKGTERAIDSYSGFFDNARRKATGLEDYLKAQGVTEVYVCGLATDYCVKFTALDAVGLGFATWLVEDASRGVNRQEGDVEKAIDQMKAAGVRVTTTAELAGQRAL